MKAPLTFKRGIHVPEHKDVTSAEEIIIAPLPKQVVLTLRQHLGAPAIPIVKKGDKVKRFDRVADPKGFISAPIHTPITGTVAKIDSVVTATGGRIDAIFITATDEENAADEAARRSTPERHDYSNMDPAQLVTKISQAGVVGLGGAAFPTSVKLTPPPPAKAEVIVINAAECEPYLTCDDALMRKCAPEIIEGIEILMKAAKVDKAIIGIENNKPEALQSLRDAIASRGQKANGISIAVLKTKYPQGGEKQLVYAVTGKEIPSGALPVSVGAIVQNVATAYAVYKAVALDQPLVERVVTMWRQGNFQVPIGLTISDIAPVTDGAPEIADVVIGGPMMGRSAITLDAPVEKNTAGVTILEPLGFDPDPCIRCGECVSACPMALEPYLIASYSRNSRLDEAIECGAKDCIECGCCVYSCPSGRPILDYIKLAKRKK